VGRGGANSPTNFLTRGKITLRGIRGEEPFANRQWGPEVGMSSGDRRQGTKKEGRIKSPKKRPLSEGGDTSGKSKNPQS